MAGEDSRLWRMRPGKKQSLILVEQIEPRILVIRGHRVILDADLAKLYGTTTKRLNEQVKRNLARFPGDFRFQLNIAEKGEVVANCDHLARLKFTRNLPYAFTEHGALMAASVLNTPAQSTPVVRRSDKPLVLEENVQNYIGEPPIWKERITFPKMNRAK